MNHWHYFGRLGLLRSFRRLYVCCKSIFYWHFELSYEHLVTTWNRRYTMLSYQCTIHWYYSKHIFCSCCHSRLCVVFPRKKKFRLTAQNRCSTRILWRVSSVSDPNIRLTLQTSSIWHDNRFFLWPRPTRSWPVLETTFLCGTTGTCL